MSTCQLSTPSYKLNISEYLFILIYLKLSVLDLSRLFVTFTQR